MTEIPQLKYKQVGEIYGVRMWIEYGFKQSKSELRCDPQLAEQAKSCSAGRWHIRAVRRKTAGAIAPKRR